MAKKVLLETMVIEGKEVVGKKCTNCSMLKPLEDYQKRNIGLGGRQPICRVCSKEYRERNKERDSIRFKQYYNDNKEYENARVKEWRDKNKERISEYVKDYYKKFPEKRILNIERFRRNNPDYQRNYYENNKHIFESLRHKRRTMSLALPNTLSDDELLFIKTIFNRRCYLTGSTDVEIDHFVPLSIGHQGNILENIILLDSSLNSSKRNKNPFEWVKARNDVDIEKFNDLVDYLAELNSMDSNEYRQFVYWCFDNPRKPDEIEADGNLFSIDLWEKDNEEGVG